MSLDPYVHTDPEIQALIQLTGAQLWMLWPPGAPPTDVYVTLRMGGHRAAEKIVHTAALDEWRTLLSGLLDKIREQEKP